VILLLCRHQEVAADKRGSIVADSSVEGGYSVHVRNRATIL